MKTINTLIISSIISTSLFSTDLVDIRRDYDETKKALEYLIVDFRTMQDEMKELKIEMKKYKRIDLISKVDILESKLLNMQKDNSQVSIVDANKTTVITESDGEIKIVMKNRTISYADTSELSDLAVDLYLQNDSVFAKNILTETNDWLCISVADKQQCFKKADIEINSKE